MNSRWRRPELWVCAGSVILSLLLGELAARRFLPPPFRVRPDGGTALRRSLHRPDPVIGWVLSAEPLEYRHRLVDQDGVVQYDAVYSVVNGQRRTSAQPAAGPVLIATGASVTFGNGLNDQDTWPWLLQEQLPDYRVMNLASMAYGTDQALLAAERQALSSPGRTAAVVLGLDDLQIDRNRSGQAWMAFVYPFSKPLFAIRPGGVEYKRQVRVWSVPFLSNSDLVAHTLNILANRVYGVPASHEEARQLTAALLGTFAKRFQALGVGFAVVVLPHADDQSPQSRADLTFLIENLHAAQIPTLIPDFPRFPGGKFDSQKFMLSSLDKHPNREYNRVLVEQLTPFLRSKGIVSH